MKRGSGRTLLVFAAIGVLAASLVAALPRDWVLGVGALGVGLAIIVTLTQREHDARLLQIVVGAFALRLAVVAMHFWVVPLPDSQFDAVGFESSAWSYAQHPLSTIVGFGGVTFYGGVFSRVLGAIYWVIGERSLLFLLALNVVLGTLVVLYSYRTARLFLSRRSARIAAGIVAVFPTLLLYSAVLMREALFVFLLSLAIFHLCSWVVSRQTRHVVLSIGILMIAVLVHRGAYVGLLATGLVLFLATNSGASPYKSAVKWAVAGAGIAAIIVAVNAGVGVTERQRAVLSVDGIVAWQNSKARVGEATYLRDFNADSALQVAAQVPLRMVVFYVAPMPWQVSSAAHLLALVDGMLYAIMFVLVVRRINVLWRQPVARVLIIFVLLLGATYAVGTSNFGTASRHRQKTAAPLIILAVGSVSITENRPERTRTDLQRQGSVLGSRL